MIYWPAKAPAEVEDFAFEFAGVLDVKGGETIATRTVTVSGVTKNSDAINGTQVQVWLQGGTLGTPGIITCLIATSAGRTYSETAILPIGEEPVTLAMAKSWIRYEDDDEDDTILDQIQTTREHVEKYCGIRLVPASVLMTFPCFTGLQSLTQAPVQSITQVQYLDTNGVLQTLDPATYEFVNVGADVLRPRLRLAYNKQWPSTRVAEDAVQVSAVVGYSVVPKPIMQAMRLMLAQWFDTRQDFLIGGRFDPLPNASDALLANFRRS
jgi:uncharacterized phiE125 gp8 family phage protein